MDVSEAAECARTIGAKHTIPYHMVPSDNPDGFDMSVAESFDATGRIILRPGEELVLEKEIAEGSDGKWSKNLLKKPYIIGIIVVTEYVRCADTLKI